MSDPTRRRSISYAIGSAAVHRALSRAFPGSRFVPIGSHSRSTAIAVHSHVDFLAVLPSAWARWGGRRVPPTTIIDRMTENMQSLPSALPPAVRCDGSGVELYFKGTIFALDVIPGFIVRTADQYPVYSMPGQGDRWIETSPERHNALFAHSNARCNAKLRALSQLIKVWRFAHSPPLGISSLYVDMMLASSDIGAGVKSYGQCMNDFFSELVRQKVQGLRDSRSHIRRYRRESLEAALERLYDAAKIAAGHAQAALDAQARGAYSEANCEWEAIFKRRLSRRPLVQ